MSFGSTLLGTYSIVNAFIALRSTGSKPVSLLSYKYLYNGEWFPQSLNDQTEWTDLYATFAKIETQYMVAVFLCKNSQFL
jgi:hypothetical protein